MAGSSALLLQGHVVQTAPVLSQDPLLRLLGEGQLAERLDGQIASLTFSEIREWPVYTFEMKVPLRIELPEAARYLREQVALENELAEPTSPATPVTAAN